MYQPYFEITPKISNNLEVIGQVFGFLKATKIPKIYEKEYLTKIIIDTVNSSTAIEGNTLTASQVGEVLRGKKINAIEKDIQEVENYHLAVKEIIRIHKINNMLTKENILKIHKIITHKLHITESGQYRSDFVIVGDYIPPEPKEVPGLMKEYIQWLQNPIPTDLSPILISGITHYRFVAIHPFSDGNGRTARILTKLMLMKYGYNITKLFSLETFYNRDRISYYKALSTVDTFRKNGKEDLTFWLEYFTNGMLIEAEKAQSKIKELISKTKVVPIIFSDSQKKAILWFKKNKTLRMQDYIRITGLSRKGAYKSLQVLLKLKYLNKIGSGKATYYIASIHLVDIVQ